MSSTIPPRSNKSTAAHDDINRDLILALKRFIHPHARSEPDREDILQNVLMKVLEKPETISPTGFFSWLRTVCHTSSIDYYRKKRSLMYELEPEIPGASAAEMDSYESQLFLANCIRPLMKNLSPEESEILSSVDLDGISQKLLSERTGIKYSSLKSKIQRARSKLKNEILQCCQVELDKRNLPVEHKVKKGNNCC